MTKTFSRARKGKDKNYDGTFFFGVRTTGIFCRPSCPAPVAKEENVVYFNTIFEAVETGFRPCRRCRPDVSIEYFSSNINGVLLVDKALEMIYNGFLSYNSLSDLSQTLDVSDRHLRKLFIDNLGLPPVKIAKYHKALFAKKLLVLSNETITDIAFAAGFGSLRQFNTVFKEIFNQTPTEARKDLKESKDSEKSATLLLKYKKPFNFGQILSFIGQREIAGVETITDTSYSRTFRTEQANGFFTVKDNSSLSALELSIFCNDIRCYMEIHNRVRRMFDLDTDFREINMQFSRDPILSKGMIDGHVPGLPVAFDPFEFVIRAILGQQISVKAATTLAGRVAEKAGVKCEPEFPSGLDYYFPTPDELLKTDLSTTGITRIRQETIKTTVMSILDGKIKLTINQPFRSFYNDFSALKGIGDWTVNYVAMRGLGMKDCFPDTDLGIIKAVSKDGNRKSKKQILSVAEKWRPYRSYATLCLWNQPE